MMKILSALAVLLLPISAHAMPISYDFSWTGNNGYSMTGSFTGQDQNTDLFIRDSEVSMLIFEGFLTGGSIGSSSTAHTLSGFNFNFDITSGAFLLGGDSRSDTGQEWNFLGTGLGWGSGGGGAALTSFGTGIGASFNTNPNFLPAAQTNTVPEPTPFALLSAGVIAIAVARRKKRKVVE